MVEGELWDWNGIVWRMDKERGMTSVVFIQLVVVVCVHTHYFGLAHWESPAREKHHIIDGTPTQVRRVLIAHHPVTMSSPLIAALSAFASDLQQYHLFI